MKVYIAELGEEIIIPQYKHELVAWLKNRYPQDEKRFRRMGNSQLRAICISCCRRVGRERELNKEVSNGM